MISRLPSWIEAGAFALALMAGVVNAVGLLGFSHQAVSHLTGTSTLLGVGLTHLQSAEVLHLLLVLLSFVLGAAFSGLFIGSSALEHGRRYGVALLVEALLLVLAMFALQGNSLAGHYLASAACGLQNAMVTTYSGAIIRTTHVSGIFTDLGVMLGARLRGVPMDRRKATLFLLLIGGFILGGTIGALGFGQWQFRALLLPAGMAVVLALVYQLWVVRRAD
ncbi:YoaK family protein [Halopseudomonas oceani]|uniref:YoaK family protein n=1 Tax=Halopseudomonas oceani TaxID=1708783 RepID=UPI002AA6E48B|nr:YoaK family protein [Halopseudomonas oceani]